MKKILTYWIIILTIYGVLLAKTQNYAVLSACYHMALLLFPLALVLFKAETFKSLGFKKGDVKQGIWWLAVIFIAIVGGIFFRAFISGETVTLVFGNLFLLFSMVALSPVSEEIFHRGLLQTKFEEKTNKIKGLILASVFFALIHVPKMLFAKEYIAVSAPLPAMSNPIMILFSFFIMGILFGHIYQRTKSINYAIAAHMLVNLVLGVLVY